MSAGPIKQWRYLPLPTIIATATELEGLPDGSIVMPFEDEYGVVAGPTQTLPQRRVWWCFGEYEWCETEQIRLPALLLWRGNTKGEDRGH